MKQFRLSTLMLLIVIAALVVALVVQQRRAARQEAELKARLRLVDEELRNVNLRLIEEIAVSKWKSKELWRQYQELERAWGVRPTF